MTGESIRKKRNLSTAEFDYVLPTNLIAQTPLGRRDHSRLLLVDRRSAALDDKCFLDLPELLNAGDLLVVNDSRVISGRLVALRPTGGRAEFLLLRHVDTDCWRALARPSSRLREKEVLTLLDRSGEKTQYSLEIVSRESDSVVVRLPDATAVFASAGRVPLPPYITETLQDPDRYQTVYAAIDGSAAAPTAGLHFTQELLSQCRDAGIYVATLTLHVGVDTFQPIRSANARDHRIHSEWFAVPSATISMIRRTRESGRRIVAVGTTSARTLESIADEMESPRSIFGWTDLYITPPYRFKLVDSMITNFHLPRTTLLLMVSAFAGRDLLQRAYQHAIDNEYRFYSFGDAMLIM